MLKICTVYFEGFYTPDYVSKLYRALKKNSTIPFEFICISDNKNIEADVILPYNHHSNIKKHWHKLKFFSPQYGNQKPGDDIIIMDIDQIIVNNVDELLGWPVSENELLSYGTIWKGLLKMNGGFYKFKSGSLKCIWDDFAKNVEFWQLNYYRKGVVHSKYYGEQNYVNWKIQEHKIELITTPKQWFARYSEDYKKNISFNKEYSKCFNTEYMILDDPHKYVKVVHFLGEGKTIHECNSNFVKKYWI
jgi:hypothetical protein